MNPSENTSYYAGFDWAKDHHDVIVIDGSGRIVGDFRIEHTSAGWRQWQEKTAAWPGLAVAVETSFGAAVEQLLHSGVKVYPVNPMSAKRYRERQCPSGLRRQIEADATAAANTDRPRSPCSSESHATPGRAPRISSANDEPFGRSTISGELAVLSWAYKTSTRPAHAVKRGETATTTMPKKMSPRSWEMLLDTLELWKKQATEV